MRLQPQRVTVRLLSLRGHCETAVPKGHYETAAPKSHCVAAAPNGHCETAAPKGHCETAAPKGHCETTASKGHCETAASKGHCESAAPKAHCESAAPKGHCKSASEAIYSALELSTNWSSLSQNITERVIFHFPFSNSARNLGGGCRVGGWYGGGGMNKGRWVFIGAPRSLCGGQLYLHLWLLSHISYQTVKKWKIRQQQMFFLLLIVN